MQTVSGSQYVDNTVVVDAYPSAAATLGAAYDEGAEL